MVNGSDDNANNNGGAMKGGKRMKMTTMVGIPVKDGGSDNVNQAANDHNITVVERVVWLRVEAVQCVDVDIYSRWQHNV